MCTVTWVLESDVFSQSHAGLRSAIQDAGHALVDWDDCWWSDGIPSELGASPTVFHGSLGNADRIAIELDWVPGSYCNTSAFRCSAWYDAARSWLLHSDWRILPAVDFIANAGSVASELGETDRVFVRPDSPLKPFSGRVVEVAPVTLTSLDHGFYFDDETIPVVVAPICTIGREWRFIVVNEDVVAGSTYNAATRSAIADRPDSAAWSFAQTIAKSLSLPADVYSLDLCESERGLRLLELNPFGGADLYACNASDVVESVTGAARNAWLLGQSADRAN